MCPVPLYVNSYGGCAVRKSASLSKAIIMSPFVLRLMACAVSDIMQLVAKKCVNISDQSFDTLVYFLSRFLDMLL